MIFISVGVPEENCPPVRVRVWLRVRVRITVGGQFSLRVIVLEPFSCVNKTFIRKSRSILFLQSTVYFKLYNNKGRKCFLFKNIVLAYGKIIFIDLQKFKYYSLSSKLPVKIKRNDTQKVSFSKLFSDRK